MLEEADREVFRDPDGKIIRPGGQIFFVVEDGEVLGTCAVIPHEPGVYEIAKMAVAPAARGRGYGDLLMEAPVAFSRAGRRAQDRDRLQHRARAGHPALREARLRPGAAGRARAVRAGEHQAGAAS